MSAIVPTLNEERTLARTLEALCCSGVAQVIVVDGGSTDRTKDIARGQSVQLVEEGGGLARQLNRGAREASGDVLLFHYADLRLPEGAVAAVAAALASPEVVGGAFQLGFDTDRPVFRLVAWCSNLRNRFGFGPFGDQAIFVRREAFERLGGYRPEAAFEDLDLVVRLKRAGRFVILKPAVRSSTRQWETRGFFPTAWSHLSASALYLLGARRRAGTLKESLQRQREV